MPWRKCSKFENMEKYSSYNMAKRQRTTNAEKENVQSLYFIFFSKTKFFLSTVPIRESHPTASSAPYSKPAALKTIWKNNSPLESAIDKEEETEEKNDEL